MLIRPLGDVIVHPVQGFRHVLENVKHLHLRQQSIPCRDKNETLFHEGCRLELHARPITSLPASAVNPENDRVVLALPGGEEVESLPLVLGLGVGEVGVVGANIKDIVHAKIGDTVTTAGENPEPLPGFADIKPMVFAGIFPINTDDYPDLRDAMDKLKLNDASFSYEPETSVALGFGFRCGFLGLLHMEIITERLQREYNQTIINTVPNVEYNVYKTDGTMQVVDNPAEMPAAGNIES